MPTFGSDPSPEYLAAIRKWTKHFDRKGVSHRKVFKLARSYARKEMRGLLA